MPENIIEPVIMPLIPLRGLSVFPRTMLTFEVERSASIAALNMAVRTDQMVFIAAQKDLSEDVPEEDDIYHVGVVCRIRQQMHQHRGGMSRVMVEGIHRAEALTINADPKGYTALIRPVVDTQERINPARREALFRSCISAYQEYLNAAAEGFTEQIIDILSKPELSYIADYIAHNTPFNSEDKQRLLEERSPSRRMIAVTKLLAREIDILGIRKELSDATRDVMEQNQREYYLREEMKIIQSELNDEGEIDDVDDYRRKIKELQLSEENRAKLLKDVSRMAKQSFGSAEAAVLRGYLDVCLEIPWGKKTAEIVDVDRARKTLDNDHFGLDKVKERILEYLAVKKLTPELKGGLICLVGPPGTGKTSIAMSVAKAMNRKLVRISLGGVHDEAEIRGHRKTYIGALPGRIINGIIQAKSCNPVMVLDEIDKLSSDYRGDPSSALLEAFDSEQNSSFRDNFVEIPFDLSDVFFITTANTTDTIPRALLDRMEVIELSSYTDEEKLQIAKRHLLPKQRKKHGLKANQLKVSDEAYMEIIRSYTRESGVRLLERELAAACRKAAGGIAEEKIKSLSLKADNLESVLGPAKFKPERKRTLGEVGLVRGLAYTSAGGEALDVEASVVRGDGKIELTGNLGDVMKESAKAAVTYIRSRAVKLGIDPDFHKKYDIHIHFPEGAVPKDGPSAGVSVCIALISALTGRPVLGNVAMTGEITLRGRVLPIGGLREKTMAALRAGATTVIIPADNLSDLAEIDQTVRGKLNFVTAEYVDDILDAALENEAQNLTEHGHIPHAAQELCAVRQ